jgi:hypothetical protein
LIEELKEARGDKKRSGVSLSSGNDQGMNKRKPFWSELVGSNKDQNTSSAPFSFDFAGR